MLWHKRITPTVIFSVAFFMHLFFLGGVLDAYFTSPLDSGLESFRSDAKPLAKRVVLFVSDGLRAEGMFKYAAWTPYLTKLREKLGVWGVGHTQVPTESRPGHIGILGGIYEDPSAIFKGWQANTVEFDSVIKQAKNTFSWGCPDIVNIFQGENVTIQPYDDPDLKDFSGRRHPKDLDRWVFTKVNKNLTQRKKRKICGHYCDEGNIFFLHLLGMDTVGHVYKPDSQQYKDTLMEVDSGVARMVRLFDWFFGDSETAYLFTSDHGMTNRGSHGSGSKHETEIPVVGWGAGFAPNFTRQDINQTDLAPLIASLLSINIPTNSIGRLPMNYLSGTPEQLAGALLANVKQIAVQYLTKDNNSINGYIDAPFKGITRKDYLLAVHNLENDYKTKSYDSVFKKGPELINVALAGIRYYQKLYQVPTLACLTIIFLAWFAFIAIFICTVQQPTANTERFSLYRQFQPKTYVVLGFLLFIVWICNVHFKFSIYAVVAFGLYFLIHQQLVQNASNLKWPESIKVWQVLLMLGYVEILVLSFFKRELLAVAMVIIGTWTIATFRNLTGKQKLRWVFAICFNSIFLFIETSDKFSYSIYLVTVLLFMLVCMVTMGTREDGHCPRGMWLFASCVANSVAIAVSVDMGQGVPTTFHASSYVYLVAAVLVVRASSAQIMSRLRTIIIALMCVYISMTMQLEGVFFSGVVILMYTWLQLELIHGTLVTPIDAAWHALHIFNFNDLPRMHKAIDLDDCRRVLFYLTFILLCFFGTGNIASISSFNPTAARAYVSDFVPQLIMVFLILKIVLPFVVCTCVFVLIVKLEKGNVTRVFAIIMLVCDVMVLNFTFLVKNEGSWQEIGMSLSHFIIAEALTLVLCVLFFVCLWVLKRGKEVDEGAMNENVVRMDIRGVEHPTVMEIFKRAYQKCFNLETRENLHAA